MDRNITYLPYAPSMNAVIRYGRMVRATVNDLRLIIAHPMGRGEKFLLQFHVPEMVLLPYRVWDCQPIGNAEYRVDAERIGFLGPPQWAEADRLCDLLVNGN